MLPFSPHPDRMAAIEEAHARPPVPLQAPLVVTHLAFRAGPREAGDLFRRVAGFELPEDSRHLLQRLSPSLLLRWQRHTEFHSVTLFREGNEANNGSGGRDRNDRLNEGDDPNGGDPKGDDLNEGDDLNGLPHLAPSDHPGIELLVAQRLRVFDTREAMRAAQPPGARLVGGRIRGDVDIRTTFEPDGRGFVDYFVAANGIGPEQLGRRIGRLIDIETYRIMALIALPLARRVSPQVGALERDLAETVRLTGDEDTADDVILDRLAALSSQAEALRADTRYRFSASRAYYAVVEQRLGTLHEEKAGDRQTLTGFIRTRLAPAITTIESVASRQATLSDDLSRALALLRTRVDIAVNRGNGALLASMDRRQRQQVLIQQAVEGLSVVAISYYGVSLLAYLLRGLDEAGVLPVPYALAVGVAVPLVLALVFGILRLFRSRWGHGGE